MTATILFSNNAKSTLAAPINTTATSLTLAAGTGALFPNPSGGAYFVLVLTDAATGETFEVLHVTARTGDVCTVTRAQESTIALNWTTGDFANNVVTAGTMDALQDGGGSGGSDLSWIVVAGTTDADVAAAVAALNATTAGGVVYFPPGVWTNLPGGYVFTKPVTVLGCGCAASSLSTAPAAITAIQCDSPTANLFEFDADPWQVQNIHLVNTSGTAPTAGCGVYSPHGNGHRLENVTTLGFFNNWQVDNASEWFWTNSVTRGPVNYAAYVRNVALPDGGDQGIVNCQFIADAYNAAAGLRFESGGGMRITNCKFNYRTSGKFVNAIDIEMNGNTVDFFISNCSIENFTGSGIKARAPSGQLNDIIVNGVQFGNYGSASIPLDFQPTSTGQFSRLMITGCEFIAPTSSVSAIALANIDNVTIGPCLLLNHPQLVTVGSGVTKFVNHNAQFGVGTLVDGSSIPMDCANHQNFNLTLGGNHTLALPTNCAPGPGGNIRVHTGGFTLSFASGWKFPGGTAPVLASGANMLSYQYDDVDSAFWVAATPLAFS